MLNFSRFSLSLSRSIPTVALSLLALGASAASFAQSVTLPAALDSVASGAETGFVALSTTGTTPAVTCSGCGTVRMTVSTTSGNIQISTISGLTAPTGYTSAQWTASNSTELAFEGSVADVDAAFATLRFKGATATLSASLSPANVLYFATTGNYYRFVSTTATWPAAKSAAEALRLWGSTGPAGYVTSVTSAAEFTFVKEKSGFSTEIWLGGTRYDAPGYTSGTGANWRWTGGAELNQVFWQGTNGGTAQNGFYTAWCSGEPNNFGTGEGVLQTTTAGCWNDLPATSSLAYFVEFDGAGQASNASTSISRPVGIPLLSPGALLLLALLLGGAGVYMRRTRVIGRV